MTLISTNICRVETEGDTLTSVMHGPPGHAWLLFYLFLMMGAASAVYGLLGVWNGWNDAGVALLSGFGLPCVVFYVLDSWDTKRGSITVDANGLTRRQGETLIGSWSSDEVTLTTRLGVLESQRLPTSLLGDQWLVASTSRGHDVYLAHGRVDELASVRDWIETQWKTSPARE